MKNIFYAPAIAILRCGLVNLLLTGAVAPTVSAQTTYYVAASGSDNNDGRSAGSPLQSIGRVNTLALQPGDQVLFRRGDTFRGGLQLRQSGSGPQPIVVDAYGSGAKPILSGSMPVSNWINLGNNVWQADCPFCGDRVTGLYRDNAVLPLGRYPNLSDANKGYLTVQSHAGKAQLTSQQSLATNWTGGEAVFRPAQWILNRAAITGQNGNTLLLDGSGSYNISDNWGFFIQNHPATLDQAGEWYYNPATRKIQLYDNQSNPNNQPITVTVFAETVNASNVSFVTIRNLQLSQSLSTALSITNSSNLVITGNDILESGEDGIVIQGAGSQILLENNRIDDANNNGVSIGPYQNVTVRGNTVRNIGLVPGRGKSGDGTYTGFQSATTGNTLIENNILDNIGYNGLNFSTSTTVQRNQISNFCMTKSDGSGLYIWNGNRQAQSDIHLLSNVVYNGVGAREGTPSGTSSAANGIYLDDCTTNIEVAGNSVYNCQGLGIFLHGSSNIRLTGNTAYNNSEGQLFITNANGCQPRNNVIQNNTFVSRLANQYNVKYESNQDDLASYGQFDNNVYARPFEDTYKIFVYNGSVGGGITLADWQKRYGKDASSTSSPLTYSAGNPDDYIKHAANATGNAIQVSLDGTYRDPRNNVYTGQVSVPAYSSVVLLKEITQSVTLRTPENPANAVAGLDYSYYEGSWGNIPDFTTLTAVKTGTTSTPSLSVRNREDNFGLRFTGYVSVPADGVYTFYVSSDDGSKLLIGNTEVVNNDGGHAEQERSGTIGLKAGTHAITVVYFEESGNQALTVSYSGPNLGKQVIPAASFWRVGTTQAPPPTTPSALRDPENPAGTVNGLTYAYFEGSWGNLPDFSTLSAVKTGNVNTPDLSVRNRYAQYAVQFKGYVSVPADGTYTFYTSSDDGSKLYIGTTEVVNNDGGHAEQERSGTIGLKAGTHTLTITYFQGSGGQALTVKYAGPGINKQVVPATAFYRTINTSAPALAPAPSAGNGTGTGLRAEFFNNKTLTAPIVLTRTDATVDVDWGDGSPAVGTVVVDNFSARWTGQVEAPATGSYVFSTSTDDGVRLWVNGSLIINDWSGHPLKTNTSTAITLTAGQKYDIRLEYFDNTGGAVARLYWAYPGQGQQVVPQNRLYPATTPSARASAVVSAEFNPEVTVEVFPIPAQDEVQIRYTAAAEGELMLQLITVAGLEARAVVHRVAPGENLIKLPVFDLKRGLYLLNLTQNGQWVSRKIILSE